MSSLVTEKNRLQTEINNLRTLYGDILPSGARNQLGVAISDLVNVHGNLSSTYDKVAATNSNLADIVAGNNDQISTLNSTVQSQQSQIAALNQERNRLNNEINLKSQEIISLNADIKSKEATIEALKAEIETAKIERDSAIIEMQDAIDERTVIALEVEPLEQQVRDLKKKIEKLEADLQLSNSKLLDTTNEISRLQNEVTNTRAEYEQKILDEQAILDNERNGLIESYLAVENEEREKLEVIQVNAGAQSSLEDFIIQTNENLTNVHKNLRESGANYHLGPIDMELKMLPGMGGNSVSLPQLADLKEVVNDHLSTIKVRFVPNLQGQSDVVAQPGDTAPVMPELTQQTATYAQRKIQALGLKVQLFQQMVEDQTLVGRILQQQPAASQAYPEDGVVALWIGKYVEPATPAQSNAGL